MFSSLKLHKQVRTSLFSAGSFSFRASERLERRRRKILSKEFDNSECIRAEKNEKKQLRL